MKSSVPVLGRHGLWACTPPISDRVLTMWLANLLRELCGMLWQGSTICFERNEASVRLGCLLRRLVLLQEHCRLTCYKRQLPNYILNHEEVRKSSMAKRTCPVYISWPQTFLDSIVETLLPVAFEVSVACHCEIGQTGYACQEKIKRPQKTFWLCYDCLCYPIDCKDRRLRSDLKEPWLNNVIGIVVRIFEGHALP